MYITRLLASIGTVFLLFCIIIVPAMLLRILLFYPDIESLSETIFWFLLGYIAHSAIIILFHHLFKGFIEKYKRVSILIAFGIIVVPLGITWLVGYLLIQVVCCTLLHSKIRTWRREKIIAIALIPLILYPVIVATAYTILSYYY